MTTPAYPTLSHLPSSVVRSPLDNAIKSPQENGIVITRRRFTKNIWQFDVTYNYLSNSDMALLTHPTTGFWGTVGTYGIFTWTYDGSTFNVRFETPIKATHNHPNWFNVSFTLVSA